MGESFTYDDMDRLTGITLKRPSGQDLHCSVTYDALGRMTSRQAVTAENGAPQVTSVFSDAVYNTTAKPHAMDAATTAEGVFPATPQAVTYTGFDKVGKVKQGNDSLSYAYGYDRQRISMKEELGGNIRIKDNLGSWTTITDGNGTVEQRLSYDAWGNLRDPNTWSGSFTGTPMFDRGFTGHEHLYDFGLINMNGRMYDPVMSGFLPVDQYVQSLGNSQNFNRYAYCLNNPLRYVDPNGELWWEAAIVGAIIGTFSNAAAQVMSGNVNTSGRFWAYANHLEGIYNKYYKSFLDIRYQPSITTLPPW